MQTDVVHLMPFFFFFLSEKRGLVAGKNREIWRSVFFCLFVSCSPSSLVLSRPPTLPFFFFPFSSSQKFSILLLVLLSTQKRKEPQFRVFCPHCIAITPSTIVLLVGRGGGGDCIDIKTSNAYGLHRNYHK